MKEKTLSKILISITILSFSASAFLAVYQLKKEGVATVFSFLNQNKKIKILIVPGHEPDAGGADEFKKIKERDLNLQLSLLLKENLSKNTNFDVILARDQSGWDPNLENYTKTSSTTIMNWVADMKAKMLAKVKTGEVQLINQDMVHNYATDEAVLFLYGINKWIAENNVDLVLHVHFNSNPKINGKPNYNGYCIYVPEKQYSNASSSLIFANYLNKEFSKIEKPSNMPQEKNTIIPDQQLIAIGEYGTLKIPVAVVEYAYIYEPKMLSSGTRNSFINSAASSTAMAINKYIIDNFQR